MNSELIKVLLSCFQKSIRRCDQLALKSAIKLDKFGYQLWNKLAVISAEDIGRASPKITTYLLEQRHKYFREKDIWKKRQILFNTVNYFIHHNKSRVADNVNHAYFKDFQPEIEMSVNLKKQFHLAIKNKNSDQAIKYASHLFKNGEENYLIDVLKRSDPESKSLIYYFNYFTKIQRNKTDVLFLVNLILHQTMDYSALQPNPDVKEISISSIENLYNNDDEIEFPDWVYDVHTQKGRDLNRSYLHFYNVSAKLHQCYLPDPYEKIARYNNCTRPNMLQG